jgi:putative ABC transport system permease protein
MPSIKEQFYHFAASDPGIINATSTVFRFAEGFNMNSHYINGKQEYTTEMNIDYNYFDFNKIPILKGRSFSKDMPTDTTDFEIPAALKDTLSSSTNRAIVINETLYDMLGKPPMDEINKEMGSRIIGVCRDYHFWGLTNKIQPAYHICNPNRSSFLWVRLKPGQDVAMTLDRIHTSFNKITGNANFSYVFLDETVQRFYQPYQRWMKTVTLFSWLAIFLSCLGLFGLSGMNAVNRTKEIGIRKVMGASVSNIFLLLNKDFVRLAIIALLIAIPLSIYFIYQWLENFAYRIHVGWTIYLWAAVIGLLSAAIAVSYHTIKAARANPVKSLRTE